MPTTAAARAAARISSAADMVSIQTTSAPPSRRPSICSTKTSTASSSPSGPSGAKMSPVGPTEPATTILRLALSATARAFSAASRLSSPTLSSSPCRASRRRLPPKLLVRTMSAPASTKDWCNARIRSGWSAFHSSGVSPAARPMANRLVPVAPSASTGRPSATRDCSILGSRLAPYGAKIGRRNRRAGGPTQGERPEKLCVAAPKMAIFRRRLDLRRRSNAGNASQRTHYRQYTKSRPKFNILREPGFMSEIAQRRRFLLFLIKSSHYDDDGYVIQCFRSALPSNSLACLNGIATDSMQRGALGPDVDIEIVAIDETNARIRPDRIASQIKEAGGLGLVGFVGVQSNQFPRVMDVARPLRAEGIQVCIGGFHVSGCLAMLPETPDSLKEALDLGISLFAGEAEGRFDEVLRDAASGTLKPVYNYLDDLPGLEGATQPIMPRENVKNTISMISSFDAGRGCPFLCSFCTIINVQGRKSRYRTADDIEQIVRSNQANGVRYFFITDDNLARNRNWEAIFDRLIALRQEGLNSRFVIQVDTACHKIPRFIEKAAAAGVKRVFIGLENIDPDNLIAAKKKQNHIADYRELLLEWRKHRCITYCGYIIGFPNDTPESVVRRIEVIQRELPVDILQYSCLTPLPGCEDHAKAVAAGVDIDPDLNKFDLEHVVCDHPKMTRAEWQKAYHTAFRTYYTDEHMKTVIRRAAAGGSPSSCGRR